MKKESFKTIILVLLVFSSIFLTINKWFSEKLWPDGYNFFSNFANFFSSEDADNSTSYLSKENISNPAKIIINNTELRSIYKHTSDEYNVIVSDIKEILKNGLAEQSAKECDPEIWKAALKGASIYISYPVAYDNKTFSAIMDSHISDFKISSMQEFIIVAGDNITGKPHLLIKDAGDDTKIADVTLGINSVEIDKTISQYAVNSAGENPYSFELNFDKSNDSIEQKIIIEPQVVLSIGQATLPTATEINYFEDISSNRSLYTKFLKAFGYNTTNLRKNVNIDNSIVFAENYSSIVMHPDGYLEYHSLDNTKGIAIGTSNTPTFYNTFIECVEFINNIWDIACGDLNMNINIASVSIDNQSSFKLTIDYYANGMEVISSLPKTDSHDKLNHAIEIIVENAKIVSYKQNVCGYALNTSSMTECGSAIGALDSLLANDTIKSDTITDLYIAYNKSDDSSICTPSWIAKTDKNEIRIINVAQ